MGMMANNAGFFAALQARIEAVDSLLCVGLDPHLAELEEKTAAGALRFCERLIEATKHVACSYKPNAAFFEVFGAEGFKVLADVIKMIPDDIPVILDSKRGDIGSTSAAYATSSFEALGAHAVTVSPYLGSDGVQPFLQNSAHAAFVLCKTSNPGSNDLQTLLVGDTPLYIKVAECVQAWSAEHSNAGLVVGATDVEAMSKIRKAFPSVWFLSPGIGAQGGDLEAALEAGLDSNGAGIILPISRGISKAGNPKEAAEQFRVKMNEVRQRRKS
jgi:uridine monophosphate synthetase